MACAATHPDLEGAPSPVTGAVREPGPMPRWRKVPLGWRRAGADPRDRLLHRSDAHSQPGRDHPVRDALAAQPGDPGVAFVHRFGVQAAPDIGVAFGHRPVDVAHSFGRAPSVRHAGADGYGKTADGGRRRGGGHTLWGVSASGGPMAAVMCDRAGWGESGPIRRFRDADAALQVAECRPCSPGCRGVHVLVVRTGCQRTQEPWCGAGREHHVMSRPTFAVEIFDDQRRYSLAVQLGRCGYRAPEPSPQFWPIDPAANEPLGSW
jgi:hypothetical protein